MKIAIAGQVALRQLADLLEAPDSIPAGLGGTPPLAEIRGLLSRGHDVSLVTLDPTISEGIVLHGERFTVRVVPSRKHHAARDCYRLERRLVARALLNCDPNVVHAHWTYEHALGAAVHQASNGGDGARCPLDSGVSIQPSDKRSGTAIAAGAGKLAMVGSNSDGGASGTENEEIDRSVTIRRTALPSRPSSVPGVRSIVIPNMMPPEGIPNTSNRAITSGRGNEVSHRPQFVESASEWNCCDRGLRKGANGIARSLATNDWEGLGARWPRRAMEQK